MYSYLSRGSDERQYCSPGVDLPVVSIMRSKYATYPEYHTSLDDLRLISPEGLEGSYEILKKCIHLLENNFHYRAVCLGEPQLGKRGLYPNVNSKAFKFEAAAMMDFLAYADGTRDLVDISNIIKAPVETLFPIIEKLERCKLIKKTRRFGRKPHEKSIRQ
jgi:aminopeptidase-like protein